MGGLVISFLLICLSSDHNIIKLCVPRTPRPLFIKQGSQFGFYITDHLGTPQRIVGSNGAILWSADYEVFGAAQISKETVTSNLRFPGQYFDDESRLHYNHFRYYDPAIGRYVQSDPIGLDGGINTYSYAYQNPISFVDPDGKIPLPVVTAGIGALAGAVTGALTAKEGCFMEAIARGVVVGGITGFLGGVGAGGMSLSLSRAAAKGGSGFGSVVSSLTGGLIGGAVSGLDAASQGSGGGCGC